MAPQYPDLARRMKIAGAVKIEAVADPGGKVAGVTTVSGSHGFSACAGYLAPMEVRAGNRRQQRARVYPSGSASVSAVWNLSPRTPAHRRRLFLSRAPEIAPFSQRLSPLSRPISEDASYLP
ncbi:MAG: energy transducer TonB [Terracidiphilus sp.]